MTSQMEKMASQIVRCVCYDGSSKQSGGGQASNFGAETFLNIGTFRPKSVAETDHGTPLSDGHSNDVATSQLGSFQVLIATECTWVWVEYCQFGRLPTVNK